MQVATWKLDRKLRPGAIEFLLSVEADALLLTGPPRDLLLEGDAGRPDEGRRNRLGTMLKLLRLDAPMRDQPRGVCAMRSIDHVAVSGPLGHVEHHSAESGGARLSDHDLYVVVRMPQTCQPGPQGAA